MLYLEEDSVANHVKDMAKHFNAELDMGNDAFTIRMANKMANGFISSYQLFKGLSVWVYNVTFLADFKVALGLSKERPYYFCYNVKGHFLHRFGDTEEYCKIHQSQNMIVRGSPKNSVQIVFPANIKLKLAIIVIDTNLLGSLEIRNAKRIYSNVQEVFRNTPINLPYRHLGTIDAETGKFASIVCENNNTDLVGELLTEGAILNMLASQIKSYKQDISNNGIKPILSLSELSNISTLGDYIIDNITTNKSIAELSIHFGLSPKKLQKGIRYLYGDSVGQYVSNLRMGHAKNLIDTTEMNVSEVCNQIGLSSQSYFSKLFKNRYGLSPSIYRNGLNGKKL